MKVSPLLLALLGLAAGFYLFVVPAMVASNVRAVGVFGVAFGLFLFFQLWMLTTEWAYQAASAFYGWRRRFLWPLPYFFRDEPGQISTPYFAVVLAFISYLLMVYGFGIIYLFVSHVASTSFNPSTALSFVDSMYFSAVTAATVGYGDITPHTALAKALVVMEIWSSLLYGVILFAAVATSMGRNR